MAGLCQPQGRGLELALSFYLFGIKDLLMGRRGCLKRGFGLVR